MRIGIAIVFCLLTVHSANAQKLLVKSIDYEESLTYFRPRIALADDGEFAVAWETLQKYAHTESWHIAVQRFHSTGVPADSLQFLMPDHVGDVSFSGFQNAEVSFDDSGMLWLSVEGSSGEQAGRDPLMPSLAFGNVDAENQFRLLAAAYESVGAPPTWFDHNLRFQPGEGGAFFLTPMSETYGVGIIDGETAFSTGDYDIEPTPLLNKTSDQAGGALRSWQDIAASPVALATVWQECPDQEDELLAACNVLLRMASYSASGLQFNRLPVVVNRGETQPAAYRPSVAMNASGQTLVTWIDYSENDGGLIYAQRFDAGGNRIGEQIVVSLPGTVVDDHEGMRPEAAIREDGSFFMVWTDYSEHGMRALGRHFDSTGKAREAPFLLDDDQIAETGFPHVDTDGHVYAYTWLSEKEGRPSIYASVPSIDYTATEALLHEPAQLMLKGYPNPFSKTATLEYWLEKSGHVTLVIYDLLGREVKKLIDQKQGPGSYHVTIEGDELAMGFYITRLQQGDALQSHLLIRN